MDMRERIRARVEALLNPAPKKMKNLPQSAAERDIDQYLKRAGYKGWSRKEESR